MENFVYTPDPEIEDALEARIAAEESRVLDIGFEPEKSQDWLSNEEGHIHNAILCNFVAVDPNVTASIMNRMFAICARKGVSTHGRPRVYKSGRHDGKYRRALRNYIVSKLLAQALGLSFDKLPPEYEAPEVANGTTAVPVERFEQLARFERWTNYKLPHSAWVIFTRDDRRELAKHIDARGWVEDGEECIKLEHYLELRRMSGGYSLIRGKLEEAAAERRKQLAPPSSNELRSRLYSEPSINATCPAIQEIENYA